MFDPSCASMLSDDLSMLRMVSSDKRVSLST
jgi:hypothetical protein